MSGLRRTEAGLIIATDFDGKITETPTIQCCHCGKHWVPQPGSGTERGWCPNCAGYVCGRDCAGKCVPVEQMLENMEKGRPLDHRPIVVPGG